MNSPMSIYYVKQFYYVQSNLRTDDKKTHWQVKWQNDKMMKWQNDDDKKTHWPFCESNRNRANQPTSKEQAQTMKINQKMLAYLSKIPQIPQCQMLSMSQIFKE